MSSWTATCGAELDDLAPRRHGVFSVRLFGGCLDGHGVLCARTQEPMTSHRHRQGNRLRHQLRRDFLIDKDTAGGEGHFLIVITSKHVTGRGENILLDGTSLGNKVSSWLAMDSTG